MDPKYLNWPTSSNTLPFIHLLVECLGLILDEDVVFVGVEFHAGSNSCFLQPVFQLVDAVLHGLTEDRYHQHQQIARCKAAILRRTLTTERCQLLLNNLQIAPTLIDTIDVKYQVTNQGDNSQKS